MISSIFGFKKSALTFWFWWRGELTHIVSIIQNLWKSSSLRIIYVDEKGWTVFDEPSTERQTTAFISNEELKIGALPPNPKGKRHPSTIIQLSQNLGLVRPLNLPIAAKANLAGLLHYEIDRLMPFRTDEIYFTYRIVLQDKNEKQILVELAAIRRATVDQAYSIAERLHLPICRIELEGAQGLDFMPSVKTDHDRSIWSRRSMSFVALLFLASVALASFEILDQQSNIRLLDTKMLSMRDEIETLMDERKEYELYKSVGEFIRTNKEKKITMTEILAELTQIIPDQAYLYQLIIDQDMIHIYGVSDKASSIIAQIERSSIFSEPRLASPVTIDNNGRERFHLSTDIDLSMK